MQLDMRKKLAAAAAVFGLIIAVISLVLLGIGVFYEADSKYEATLTANAEAEAFNRDNAAAIAAYEAEVERTGNTELAEDPEAGLLAPREVVPVTWMDQWNWVVTIVIVGFFTLVMLALVVGMLWRRDPGTPMTWAEAIVFATVAFYFIFVLVNSVIPHYIINLWDNVLQIRGPITVPLTQTLGGIFNDSAVGWEWQWVTIRDFIVTGWYIVTLVATIAFWYWAQVLWKRQPPKSDADDLSSPYGRPMLRTGQ